MAVDSQSETNISEHLKCTEPGVNRDPLGGLGQGDALLFPISLLFACSQTTMQSVPVTFPPQGFGF